MPIIAPERIKQLQTDVKMQFQTGTESAKVDVSHKPFSLEMASTSASNTYEWLGEMPDVTEWIGPRKLKSVKSFVYEIKNKAWENAIVVTEMDLMNNNLAGKYVNAQALGVNIMSHPAKMAFVALACGHLAPCYDGQNFFDLEHPSAENTDGSGVVKFWANMSAPAGDDGLAWFLIDNRQVVQPIVVQKRTDVRFMTNGMDGGKGSEAFFMEKTIKFGADYYGHVGYGLPAMAYRSTRPLTIENLQAAWLAMSEFTGDGGRNLEVSPTLLVVPELYRFKALAILKTKVVSATDNIMFDSLELLTSAKLNKVPTSLPKDME